MSQSMKGGDGSLTWAMESDVGKVRSNNEDSHAWARLSDGSLLVVVADGMGGHEAGEVASGLAVQVIEDAVGQDLERDPRERIYHALLEANAAIREEGRRSGTRGMGTTSVVALLMGMEAHIGLVGDSRCYHLRRGQLIWRTVDHTRVQDLVDKGQIGLEEARNHPEAGMLTRALGHEKMADGRPLVPDVLAEPVYLEPEDALVLCSDGLHDLLDDYEITQQVAGETAAQAAEELVHLARERGGHDNITVAVIVAGERASPYDPEFVPEPVEELLPVPAPALASAESGEQPVRPPVASAPDTPHAAAPGSRRRVWLAVAVVSVLGVVGVVLASLLALWAFAML